MSTIFVSVSGNDSLGLGTIASPYRTIGRAMLAAVAGDVIDVGTGTFDETSSIQISANVSIRGKGYDKTLVKVNVTTGRLFLLNSGTITRVLFAKLHLMQVSESTDLIQIASVANSACVIIARCLLTQRSGYAVNNSATSAVNMRVDLLNCILREATLQHSAIAFRSTVIGGIAARNCVFVSLGLIVDDSVGGQSCDMNFNDYINCSRHFRVGEFGDQDLVDVDPQFQNYTATNLALAPNSKLINAGVDLSLGYGTPQRLPPQEMNWGYDGTYPDIGIVENFQIQSSIPVRTYTFHLILSVFARALSEVHADHRQSKLDRFIDTASTGELYKRWGVVLDAIRPATMPTETYRALLIRLLNLYITTAPASAIQDELPIAIFNLNPQFEEYYKSQRFVVTNELKIKVVTPVPSLDVEVEGGMLQLARKWYRVLTDQITVPSNQTSLIYVEDTVVTGDDITLTIQQSTNTSLRLGFKPIATTGSGSFRTGFNKVFGVGTTFLTQLKAQDVIRAQGDLNLYIIESVDSNTELTLTEVYRGVDVTAVVQLARPIQVLGEVTTNGTTVTDIKASGRLGETTFANSAETKGHGYNIILNDDGSRSIFDKTDENRLLLDQISRSKAAHKLAFVSFIGDIPHGQLVGADRDGAQSNVDYLETFETPSWIPA